jgi:hypothetical protein
VNARLQRNKIKRIRVEIAITAEAVIGAWKTAPYEHKSKYAVKWAFPDHLVIHNAEKIDVLP